MVFWYNTQTMNIFIPKIGTQLLLNEPWTFKLYDEYRNYDYWTAVHGTPPERKNECRGTNDWYRKYAEESDPIFTTLPKGTILSVDRIYIRKGNKEYDSVSFRVLKGSPGPTGRFWAKLDEVNEGLNVSIIKHLWLTINHQNSECWWERPSTT